MRVYRARFLAALALTGILVLMVLGGVGIFRLIIKRDEREVRETVQETMEIVDEDMGQLDERKDEGNGICSDSGCGTWRQ